MKLYSEYKLNYQSRFVKKIWVLDNSDSNHEIDTMKVLPNGCFNYALVVGNGANVLVENQTYNLTEGIYLFSQITDEINVKLLKKTKAILIQLNVFYFSYYQQTNFTNFKNKILKHRKNNEIFNQHINLNSKLILEDTIKLTENYFSAFDEKFIKQNLVENLANKILSSNGNCKISKILEEYDYSERWIQLCFKKTTGLTLKQFAKIIQFRKSIDKISFDENSNLTSIAYELGYNDQSHFIKIFNSFTSTKPNKFKPDNYFLSFIE